MSELTVTVLRLGLLILLWAFVLSLAGVLRSDLYGTRVIARQGSASSRRSRKEKRAADTPRRNPRTPTHLVITGGALAGTSLPLRDKGVLIGRNPECTLVLDDDFASGRHARIIRGDDGWYVEDLGSTNGTFIGEFRVGEAVPVEAGTTVRIGKTRLELRS
ncbi:FHA domain-containing protein [Janibacter melonis]|uniref:FHA domain-containing protein FhaB/FipA n=1 Tax=Janibacter TaxID=53457 RepID=UPI002043A115|nr:FHA domain-containing protein [Janibacter melonis]MCM3555620.1 FHA domain-containing protein [Janibacter melonis]